MFFISEVLAQDATPTTPLDQGISTLGSLFPFAMVFIIFYFLLIRPQQKKMREYQRMVQALRRGDKIVTGGGIYGTITKLEEGTGMLHVEIAPNVTIRVKSSTISEVISHPLPMDEKKRLKLKKLKKTVNIG